MEENINEIEMRVFNKIESDNNIAEVKNQINHLEKRINYISQ